MKKVFATLTVLAMLAFGGVAVMAQDEAAPAAAETEQMVEEAAPAAAPVEAPAVEEAAAEDGGLVALHKALKTKFIEGGAGFMAATFLCLVFG